MKIYLLSKTRRKELQMEVRELRKSLMKSILKMDNSQLSKFHFLKFMISYILLIHTIKLFNPALIIHKQELNSPGPHWIPQYPPDTSFMSKLTWPPKHFWTSLDFTDLPWPPESPQAYQFPGLDCPDPLGIPESQGSPSNSHISESMNHLNFPETCLIQYFTIQWSWKLIQFCSFQQWLHIQW